MITFEMSSIVQALPLIKKGIATTVFLSLVSSIFAFVIGVTVAFFRNMGNSLLKSVLVWYIEIVRNTPLLIQIYIYYKGLPGIGIQLSPIVCGLLSLSIYTGAFISEVLRAGINSIPIQQQEAARGLGLSKFQSFYLVIFPQAIRVVIPPLGSQFINLIKNSSLVSFIAVSDVFYVVYKQAVDDFRFLEFFIVGALIYMVLTGIVALLTNIIENKYRLSRGNVNI